MRAIGLSLLRILEPVFVIAALAALTALALSELVVPVANRERDTIYDLQIQNLRRETTAERPDLTYLGSGGRIWYARLYLVNERRLHEVSLQEFEGDRLKRRIDATECTWDGTQWLFTHGIERTFVGDREVARPFDRLVIEGLRERPEDFAKESRNPTEMNYFELRKFVDRLRASGGAVAKYLVDLHLKLAFPLVNFIVVIIGASLATQLRLQSAAIGFGLSVAISFVYYALMRTGQALGHTGALPPYAAAWLGDVVFGLIALVMLYRAQSR
jgi:lipopolysaccharide export system permease protein